MAAERLTQERRRAMTRQALIEAAAEAFAARGFYGASLEEIAEAAGFTRGAIYSNFANKEDLLLGVLDHFFDVQLSTVSEVVAQQESDDNAADVAAAFAAWRRSSQQTASWAALTLELRLAAIRNPEIRERLLASERRGAERIAQLISSEATRRGTSVRIPVADFADISRASLDGIMQLAAIDPDNADRYRKLVEELFTMLADVAFVGQPAAEAPMRVRKSARSGEGRPPRA